MGKMVTAAALGGGGSKWPKQLPKLLIIVTNGSCHLPYEEGYPGRWGGVGASLGNGSCHFAHETLPMSRKVRERLGQVLTAHE